MARGVGYYIDDIGAPESPPCHPNARKVHAEVCHSDTTATWGCITVTNLNGVANQVPQMGTLLDGGNTHAASGNPIYYKVIQIDPADPAQIGNYNFDVVPGTSNCGYECNQTGCHWTGLPGANYTYWVHCNTDFLNGVCGYPEPSWFCQDFNCFEILYQGGATGGANMTSLDVLGHIVGAASKSCWDPGEPWENVGISLDPGPSTQQYPQGSNPNYLPNIPVALHGSILRNIYNAGPCHGYFPLSHSVDDCIGCCGGLNIQFTGSGQNNPLWTWVNANPGASSGSFNAYVATLGVDSCGQV